MTLAIEAISARSPTKPSPAIRVVTVKNAMPSDLLRMLRQRCTEWRRM